MFRKCCSIVVGLVYVASGLLKVMDPVGTGLIVEAYFRFLHIPELAFVAKILGVVLGVVETTVGFAAVFCVWPRITRWIMLGMQSAFTLLSMALVIWNPQMHCGCFGEAVHLTHWQTFMKNIVLMGMLWFAYFPLWEIFKAKMWQYIAFASSVALMAGFAVYSWYYIPVIDFTDYKIGTEIVDQREYWELSDDERKNHATIPMIGTDEKPNPDLTKGKWAIISLYNLPSNVLELEMSIYKYIILETLTYHVVFLVDSSIQEINDRFIELDNELNFSVEILNHIRNSIFITNRTTAIALNRKNGGIVLMEDGVIINKLASLSKFNRN